MPRSLLAAAVSAIAIGFAGTAVAQTTPSSPSSPPSSDTQMQTPPGGAGGSDAQQAPSTPPSSGTGTGTTDSAPPASGGAAAKPEFPPQSVVGMTLLNSQGEEIGEVDKIVGNEVVVSVGGFLGIGAHDVALPWKELTMSGDGQDAKLITTMTEEDLKALPEYEEPSTGGGTTGGTGGMTQ